MRSLSLALTVVATAALVGAQACTTLRTGIWGGLLGHPTFGLDEHHQLVSPDVAVVTNFTVDYQQCPESGDPSTNGGYYIGRILLHTSSFVGANTCLTIINPAAGQETYNAKAEACVSDSAPPPSQQWVWSLTYGFGLIDWVGLGLLATDFYGCEAGYLEHNDTGLPHIASGTHLIEMACDLEGGFSLSSFVLYDTNGTIIA